MIIVLKNTATEEQITSLRGEMSEMGLAVQDIHGENTLMIGLAGATEMVSEDSIVRHEFVEKVLKISEPYKLAGRKFHPKDSIYEIAGRKIGGGAFAVIAGPCSVESEEQMLSIARDVKTAGAGFLRGGAFKPRSSPYSFQGLGLDGLELLKIAREKTGLPIVTEIMSQEYVEIFEKEVDVIQIGARNMQNFPLLREIGRTGKPVLLKRGLSSTIDEMLMAAEYILKEGNNHVILCERGIRTFETATRNTLDLSAIPVIKKRSHLPVIVDPSHGTGYWDLVYSMSLAAAAAGADGLMIEVHNQPVKALCDGQQSITPYLFSRLMRKVEKVHEIVAAADI
ncbi:MAG: 3-deoxy-7-phosphoheptulonate synthase [Clostridiales Family XIII bacterium]|jgi:3-deoxy-7-phosphoheptulonate synthase|nr:3-deoxy-7-phosphoheptulonate synthase [Clostridiales Family XIII bacterium]